MRSLWLRWRFALGLLALATSLGFGLWLLVAAVAVPGVQRCIEELRLEQRLQGDELAGAMQRVERMRRLRDSLQNAGELLERRQAGTGLAGLLGAVNAAAQRGGVVLLSTENPVESPGPQGWTEMTLRLRVRGSVQGLHGFLGSLETGSPLFRAQRFELRGTGQGGVEANLELVTWRRSR